MWVGIWLSSAWDSAWLHLHLRCSVVRVAVSQDLLTVSCVICIGSIGWSSWEMSVFRRCPAGGRRDHLSGTEYSRTRGDCREGSPTELGFSNARKPACCPPRSSSSGLFLQACGRIRPYQVGTDIATVAPFILFPLCLFVACCNVYVQHTVIV